MSDNADERFAQLERRLEDLGRAVERANRTDAPRDRERVEDILDKLDPEERKLLETHRFRSRFDPAFDEAFNRRLAAIVDELEQLDESEESEDDEGEKKKPAKKPAGKQPPGRHPRDPETDEGEKKSDKKAADEPWWGRE